MTAETPFVIASRLRRLGLSVIPIPRPRIGVAPGHPGDGKVPAIRWREFQHRFATDDELGAFFGGQPVNLAVVTGGISGVVVIDGDTEEAWRWLVRRLPYTPWQTKTARGFHLWYRHPIRLVPNRARLETPTGRLAIDVRGDGGYVIAPGSVHASGVPYEFAGEWTRARAELPVFWSGWLQRRRRPPTVAIPQHRPRGDVAYRARKYLAAIPPPQIGAGSDAATLYAACRLVRGFALPASEAEQLLWDWAGHRPTWTRTWIAVKVQHALLYGTEPIGALR